MAKREGGRGGEDGEEDGEVGQRYIHRYRYMLGKDKYEGNGNVSLHHRSKGMKIKDVQTPAVYAAW